MAYNNDIGFYFFSTGKERFWLKEHGIHKGKFSYEYLPSFNILGTIITPSFPLKLLRGKYNINIFNLILKEVEAILLLIGDGPERGKV